MDKYIIFHSINQANTRLLDMVIPKAHRIELKGKSLRMFIQQRWFFTLN